MRCFFFLLLCFSSLNGFTQVSWQGNYDVKYAKELSVPRESKVRIWTSVDSLNQLRWSFTAFQRNEWVWENSGYCVVIDSNRLELFLTNYKHFDAKVQNKVRKKIRVDKILYIVTRINDMLYIEAKDNKRKLRIIKE